jgi:hypothetical protein
MIKIYKKGDKFNHLTFIKDVSDIIKGGVKRRHSSFRCICGIETIKITSAVTTGRIKSCGKCKLSYIIPDNRGKKSGVYKHGMFGTRFYNIYYGIRARCKDKRNKWYAGKSIKCLWKSFGEFKKDMYVSYLRHCKKFGIKNTTIDRIDSNKDYSKENCRWATYLKQENNRGNNSFRIMKGQKRTIAQWMKKLNKSAYFIKKMTAKSLN